MADLSPESIRVAPAKCEAVADSPQPPVAKEQDVLREHNSSKQALIPPSPKQQVRRRLSVAEVDGSGIPDLGDNRGLITELDLKTLIDLKVGGDIERL